VYQHTLHTQTVTCTSTHCTHTDCHVYQHTLHTQAVTCTSTHRLSRVPAHTAHTQSRVPAHTGHTQTVPCTSTHTTLHVFSLPQVNYFSEETKWLDNNPTNIFTDARKILVATNVVSSEIDGFRAGGVFSCRLDVIHAYVFGPTVTIGAKRKLPPEAIRPNNLWSIAV
jgi:hypothetical protein